MADPDGGTGSARPEALRVGAEIPAFARTTGPANWNRYAAVNDEFVAIHMDDEAGRAAGAPGAFGMGNLQWAYLHNMLRDWLGDRGRIMAVSCQLREKNTKGQTVTARGRVTAIRSGGPQTLIDLDVWTEDQERRTLAKGTATAALLAGPGGEPGHLAGADVRR
jgi:acyl dehydratase